MELADICKEVGLPAGVLNILTGLGHEAGAPLVSHPHVDKVPFISCHFVIDIMNLIFLYILQIWQFGDNYVFYLLCNAPNILYRNRLHLLEAL